MKFLYKMKNEVYKIGNISGDVSVKSIKKAEIKGCGTIFLLFIEVLIIVILSITTNV